MFHWLRKMVRDAFMAGVQDALEELKAPHAHPPAALLEERAEEEPEVREKATAGRNGKGRS